MLVRSSSLLTLGVLWGSAALSRASQDEYYEIFNVTDPRCKSADDPYIIKITTDPQPPGTWSTPSGGGGGIQIIFPEDKGTAAPTDAPTSSPTIADCEGMIKSLSIVDADTGNVIPGYEKLNAGTKLVLSELPDGVRRTTIVANPRDSTVTEVHFKFATSNWYKTDKVAPFTIDKPDVTTGLGMAPFPYFQMSGTYSIAARAKTNNWENIYCSATVEVDYGNPGECKGLMTGMSLVNITTQEPIPGYESLVNDQKIVLSSFTDPKEIALVANSNGYEKGEMYFMFGARDWYRKQTTHPYALAGTLNDLAVSAGVLQVKGTYKIRARGKKANGYWEDPNTEACNITLHVEYGNPPGMCEGAVTGFGLVDTETQLPVPFHENLHDGQTLDLSKLPRHLSIVAYANGVEREIYFSKDTRDWYKHQPTPPYSMAGKDGSTMLETHFANVQGKVTIGARAKLGTGTWEPKEDWCQIELNIVYGDEGRCDGLVKSLSLIDSGTGEVIPGYESLRASQTLDLSTLPATVSGLTIEAHGVGSEKEVYFGFNTRDWYQKRVWGERYYMSKSNPHAALGFLNVEGTYTIKVRGKTMENYWESSWCSTELTVEYGGDGICEGLVVDFALIDVSTGLPVPGREKLKPGDVLDLTELPPDLTIKALSRGAGMDQGISFGLDTRDWYKTLTPDKEYLMDSVDESGNMLPSSFLKVAGSYKVKARAKMNTGTWETSFCELPIEVTYGTPTGDCTGLVQGFSLVHSVDGNPVEVVPGFETIQNNAVLDLAELPPGLSIQAKTVGVENKMVFGLDTRDWYQQSETAPHYISDVDENGNLIPENFLQTAKTYKVRARALTAKNQWETNWCEINVQIKYGGNYQCPGLVHTFELYDALENKPINGFAPLTDGQVIDIDTIASPLTIVAKTHGFERKVRFSKDERTWFRTESTAPYSMSGDMNGDFLALSFLREPGQYRIKAKAQQASGWWEPDDMECGITITVKGTVVDDRWQPPAPPPESPPERKVMYLIASPDDETCAPKYVRDEVEGDVMFFKTPIKVVDIQVNSTVQFQTVNYIKEGVNLDWMTASFVTPSGVRVCDMEEHMEIGDTSDIYTAKCFDGFAYVDLYASDSTFDETVDNADVTSLHAGCKNDVTGKKIKYTFVMSCDCDNIPEIPEVVVGGTSTKSPTCFGKEATSWGDPHLVTWDGKKFDCQGNGEFNATHADIKNKDYDLDIQTRFRKHGESKWGMRVSFNDGIVVKQDHSVQIARADVVTPGLTTYFGTCPINFYVDGVQRSILQGTGMQHKVMVLINGFNVNVFFPETGVTVKGKVRPGTPCKFDYDLCLPHDNSDIVNVTGLYGNRNGNSADDFRDTDNNEIDIYSAFSGTYREKIFDYCTQTWCNRDESKSLFTYDSDEFGFDHYQKCDFYSAGGEIDLTGAPEKIKEICGCLEDWESPSCYKDCVMDGMEGDDGEADAIAAMAAIDATNAARLAALYVEVDADDACCSSDYKNCISDSCNKYDCNDRPGFVWLGNGPYEDDGEGDFNGCLPKEGTCQHHEDCCPGLDCNSQKCAPSAGSARRLESVKPPRPDLKIKGATRLFNPNSM